MPTTSAVVETEVIIVGGGPVGLTLAHELGARGVAAVLVEPRTEPDLSSPRCKQVNPRSMEQFRRLGLAERIRGAAPLPFGWSDSAVFCTSLLGDRIERFDGVFALSDVPHSELPEPAQWTAQFSLEAALRAALPERATITARWGARLVDLHQDADGVLVTVQDPDGATTGIRGRYLAAADGGRSTARTALGIGLSGRSHAIENLQVVLDAPGLAERHPQGRAVQYWVIDEQVSGLLGPLDRSGGWWAIIIDAPAGASAEWVRRALHTMIGTANTDEQPITIRSQDPWTARMLVADRYRAGRCFLLGDAAHLNPPWGGFGANTGIGDAVDLGWKLAATLTGWAGADLLDSYETERRPIAHRVIAEAERNMAVLTPELSRLDPSAAADAIRRTKTAETYTLGFVLGAGCPSSPIVVPDGRPAPASETSVYRPSAAPGMRLPHLWLGPGRSLYDRLGPGFTLLAVGAPAVPDDWAAAAATRGLPLRTVALHRPDAHQLFHARYLLVRPDLLVAWRGDELPADPGALLDHVRGALHRPPAPTTAPTLQSEEPTS